MSVDGVYLFGSALTELTLRLGGRSDSSGGVAFANRVTNWLNTSQAMLARTVLTLPDLDRVAELALIEGQNEYSRLSTTPPLTDVLAIRCVQIVDDSQSPQTKMRARRFPWLEYRALSSLASRRPTRWTRRGDLIAFDATPDSEYYTAVIDYRRRPTLGQSSLNTEWQEPWLKLAESLGWAALGNHERAAQLRNELPLNLRNAVEQPLDEEQMESMFDPDLAIVPESWERGWYVGSA